VKDATPTAQIGKSLAERGRADPAESAQLLGRQRLMGLCQGPNDTFRRGDLLRFGSGDLVENRQCKAIALTVQIERDIIAGRSGPMLDAEQQMPVIPAGPS